jgi:hypothetical protein
MIPKPQKIFLFANGNVAAFDHQGRQIPELQVAPIELWADHASALGVDIDGTLIETPDGHMMKFFKAENGWNRETLY